MQPISTPIIPPPIHTLTSNFAPAISTFLTTSMYGYACQIPPALPVFNPVISTINGAINKRCYGTNEQSMPA